MRFGRRQPIIPRLKTGNVLGLTVRYSRSCKGVVFLYWENGGSHHATNIGEIATGWHVLYSQSGFRPEHTGGDEIGYAVLRPQSLRGHRNRAESVEKY